MSTHADTQAQPAPAQGKQSVTDAVMQDILFRREYGRKKYGTELQSHNGRDALADAYQEALDLVMYLKQALIERDGGEHGRDQLPAGREGRARTGDAS